MTYEIVEYMDNQCMFIFKTYKIMKPILPEIVEI